jgi:integrase
MKSHLKTSHLVVKNKDKNDLSAVYVEISIGGQQKRFATGVKLKRKLFPSKNLVKSVDLRNIVTPEQFQNISHVERRIDEIIVNWKLKHGEKPISIAGIEREMAGNQTKDKYIFDYYDEFLEIKKAGNYNTYINHRRTRDLFLEFTQKVYKVITFDDINNICLDKFRAFLDNHRSDKNPNGMLEGSVIARLEKLREFINYYYEAKKHSNTITQTYKLKKKAPSMNKFIVTLTKEELRAIKNYKFESKRLERIQKLFVLQCMMGQRYIDFIRLDSSMYSYQRGNYYLKFMQYKTEKEIEFKLHPEAVPYFESLVVNTPDKKIKPITNSKYNNYVKEMLSHVAEKCESLKENITKTNIIGAKKLKETWMKYQWVSTHTARRTWINLALESGVPVKTIMSVTGHSKSDILDVYINKHQYQEELLDKIDF